MEKEAEGLRCQDVNLGLRIGSNSWTRSVLDNTQIVGMAADLAGLIRGVNIIEDVDPLKIVASETLDISPNELEPVLGVLESCDFIEVQRSNGRTVAIADRVPVFQDLYSSLGSAWRERKPRQLEEEVITAVHLLARSPIPLEELVPSHGFDKNDIADIVKIGEQSSVIRQVETLDGILLYSPYTAFENPTAMHEALINHGPGELADALGEITDYQGLPIDPVKSPILSDAVAMGIISAPSVELRDGTLKPFGVLPHLLDQELTTTKKMILDKALTIVACIRCGQHFGGKTNTRDAIAVINALLEQDYLNPHGSHQRQYKLMRDQGIIEFLPDMREGGKWVRPALIKTEDNIEAMKIARGLLSGENLQAGRDSSPDIKKLLGLDAKSLKSLQTSSRKKATGAIDSQHLSAAFESLMGRNVQ